jgi:hypothetical protein
MPGEVLSFKKNLSALRSISRPLRARVAGLLLARKRHKPSAEGAPRVDLAIPTFGYENHIGIDRRHGLIRTWTTTDASRHDGAVLPELIDKNNTASEVWADTAYRSQANEKYLADRLLRSQIHRKKPKGKPVSLFEPHADIIVNGARDVQYGHKLNLVTGKSGLILDLVATGGRDSEVRFLGEVANTPAAVERLIRKLSCRKRQPAGAAIRG